MEDVQELYRRIVFNVCVGNTDDHARNHSMLWDGTYTALAPAYDICPYPRIGREATHAMAIHRDGRSWSQLALCVEASVAHGLTEREARDIIDHQVDTINTQWRDVAEQCHLTEAERDTLWHRSILNPHIFEGY